MLNRPAHSIDRFVVEIGPEDTPEIAKIADIAKRLSEAVADIIPFTVDHEGVTYLVQPLTPPMPPTLSQKGIYRAYQSRWFRIEKLPNGEKLPDDDHKAWRKFIIDFVKNGGHPMDAQKAFYSWEQIGFHR